MAAAVRTSPNLLTTKLSDPRAVAAIGLKKRLPKSTRITQMLKPAAAAKLTPEARKLTKEDLVKMQQGTVTPAALNLTVRDIASIQTAFRNPSFAGLDVSCCCCTPCCCAAAVETESAIAA